MPFVNVKLVAPNGKRYRVEIDSDLSIDIVRSQLLEELKIISDKKYDLLLVNSFSLSPDDEVRLIEATEQAVRHLVQIDGQDGQ